MSRLMTSSSGVALIRSVTMSVQCPKIFRRRSFWVPGSSFPPAGSLWNAYLHCIHHSTLQASPSIPRQQSSVHRTE